MEFPGAAALVTAMTGGRGFEQDAYTKEKARLIAAKTAAASMDKKVAEAAMAKTENAQFQDLSKYFNPREVAVIQSGTAADFSALQGGLGKEQENQLRENIKGMIEGMIKSGRPAMDVFNATMSAISGKTMTAGEVGVDAQSNALLQKTIAEVGSQNALTIKRNREGAAAGNVAEKTGGVTPKGLTQGQIDTLYNLPVTTEQMVDGGWFSADEKQMVTEPTDMIAEFYAWQARNAAKDPRYWNSDVAMPVFIEAVMNGSYKNGANPTTAETTAPAPNVDKSKVDQEKRNKRLIFNPATGDFQEVSEQ